MFFDRGTFWVLPLTYFYIPKVPGRTFLPNLSKFITFAAAPLALTPFVRNQGSRGGSSGSPIVNRAGHAIALNAAARGGTMHALFLPLHRVKRALEAVREGLAVPRGTLCTAFSYVSFPECLRLGVAEDFVQERVLAPPPAAGGTFTAASPPGGMLKVNRSIPGCAAAAVLRPGDVLLELDGKACADFVLFEAVLDDAVGQSVQLALCRGSERVEVYHHHHHQYY